MNQNPPGAPQKKSGSGCLIALAIVGGIFAVLALIIGVAVYQFAKSEKGSAIIDMVGQTKDMVEEGMNAPGAAQVRALGCDQAVVMDMGKIIKLATKLFDAGSENPLEKESSLSVICTIQMMGGTPPECDLIATTYVQAIGGTSAQPFNVMVQKQGNNKPICSGKYDVQGVLEK
jgi:hypothetical protein